MNKEERLIKEVKDLLAGRKGPSSVVKEILYDRRANQFIIKLPRDLVLASKLGPGSKIKIVVNPSEDEISEAKRSHFIIYGKETEEQLTS